jgi:glycerol-3-phosphate dehydrogenase
LFAEAFASRHNHLATEEESRRLWQALLKAQKIQGTLAAEEFYTTLEAYDLLEKFPLIDTIYTIALKGKQVESIIDGIIVQRTRD